MLANFSGETLFSVPYLGYAMKYLQQPAGKIIIAVIVIAIIAMTIVDIFVERKEKSAEKSTKASTEESA